MKFHHIGIACDDIEKMKQYLHQIYVVAEVSRTIFDELQQAELCIIKLKDGTRIELVSGIVVEKLVKKRQFLYHICYTENDIEKKMQELEAFGARIVSEPKSAKLFGGRRVAFMMTKLGLVELLESGEESGNGSAE